MKRPREAGAWVLIAGLAWIAAVAVGQSRLLAYESAPGDPGRSPRRWPAPSRLRPDPLRSTLVMIAHPRCPCTRASLTELTRILNRCGDRVAAHVLFVAPAGVPRGWERSDLWRRAAAIPGVRVHRANDAEALRFGAETSGHVALYDAGGSLLYAGGITGARGQEGENAASRAVVRLIDGQAPGPLPVGSRAVSYVFGCPLRR